jgi:hypothetical protein
MWCVPAGLFGDDEGRNMIAELTDEQIEETLTAAKGLLLFMDLPTDAQRYAALELCVIMAIRYHTGNDPEKLNAEVDRLRDSLLANTDVADD